LNSHFERICLFLEKPASKFMNSNFDNKTYSQLLAEIAPQVIETEEEYERLLKVAEFLTFKKNLTPEERALDKLIVRLIEDYEEENYPMDESTPHDILLHIMESSGIRQADLVRILGSSSGVVSEVVNGKRSISKAQAKALGEYFKVSPSLFI
jgi:HTH-type transcriptional regulator/antitoxin HigA